MADWSHSPTHRLGDAGAYMVTAGTYRKAHHFASPDRLTLLRHTLFDVAEKNAWLLQAWAVLSNHYHFVAMSPSTGGSLRSMVQELHSVTAKRVNEMDGTPGRKVWFQYWDTHLTFQHSYLVRLKYVHQNPVHHGLVINASTYPWCSAGWFERVAERSFYRTVAGLKIDRVKVFDDFEVMAF